MQLFRDLDIQSFVRIRGLNWSGHVNRMKSKKEGSQVLNSNPGGGRLRG